MRTKREADEIGPFETQIERIKFKHYIQHLDDRDPYVVYGAATWLLDNGVRQKGNPRLVNKCHTRLRQIIMRPDGSLTVPPHVRLYGWSYKKRLNDREKETAHDLQCLDDAIHMIMSYPRR